MREGGGRAALGPVQPPERHAEEGEGHQEEELSRHMQRGRAARGHLMTAVLLFVQFGCEIEVNSTYVLSCLM